MLMLARGNIFNNRIPNNWLPKRLWGLRYYDTPIWRPLWPFFLGGNHPSFYFPALRRMALIGLGIVVYWGLGKIQNAMMNSEQYYNDPRHPRCIAFRFMLI